MEALSFDSVFFSYLFKSVPTPQHVASGFKIKILTKFLEKKVIKETTLY